MGGPIEKGQLANFSWELPISQVRFELKSNVVPIGKIKSGIHIHRALLFKVCIIWLVWQNVIVHDFIVTISRKKFQTAYNLLSKTNFNFSKIQL